MLFGQIKRGSSETKLIFHMSKYYSEMVYEPILSVGHIHLITDTI